MRENSVKCALWLQKSCYKNIVISICTRHQGLAYIPFLASLYIGAIINPWDDKYFEGTLIFCLKFSVIYFDVHIILCIYERIFYSFNNNFFF